MILSALPSEDFAEYLPKKWEKDVIKEVEHGLESSDKSIVEHFQKARYMNLRPDTWVNKKAMTKESFVDEAKKINNIVIDWKKIDLVNVSDPYLLVKVLLSYLWYTWMHGNKLDITKTSDRMADILPEQKDLYIALLKFQSLNVNSPDKRQSAYSAKNKDVWDDWMADWTIGWLTLRWLIFDATEKQHKEVSKRQEVENINKEIWEELNSVKADVLGNNLDEWIKKLKIDFDAMAEKADFIMNWTFYYSKDSISDLNDSDKPIDVSINDKITYLKWIYKEFDWVFTEKQKQVVGKLIESYEGLLDNVISFKKEKQADSKEVSYIDSKVGRAWTNFEKSFDDSWFWFKDEKWKFRDDLKKSEFKQVWESFVNFQSKFGENWVKFKPDINLYLWLANDMRWKVKKPWTLRYINSLIKMYNPFFEKKDSYDAVTDAISSRLSDVWDKDYDEIMSFFNNQWVNENLDTQKIWDNNSNIVSWSMLSEGQKNTINEIVKSLVRDKAITKSQYDDFKYVMRNERALFWSNTFVGNTEYDNNSGWFSKVIDSIDEKSSSNTDNLWAQSDFERSIWLPAKQKELISVFEWKLRDPNLTAEELKEISVDVVSKREKLESLLSSEELKYKDLLPLPDHIIMLKSLLSKYKDLEKRISILAKDMLDDK